MEVYQTECSKELYKSISRYLVDGVASSFHKPDYSDYPICIDYGRGSHLYDMDGNEYVDYICGFGPMLLGYSSTAVKEAVIKQISAGTHFAAPTKMLYELSKKLTEIMPCAEMVSFQNSGTEAVMSAFRYARAYTGKKKIIKFEGQYHGWSDEEKVTIDAENIEMLGDRENPKRLFHSMGQREETSEDLIILPWNDSNILEETLKAHGSEIAAVITEPIMCDSGPILPERGYLRSLRRLTTQYKAVLIFDEVITGFRIALGGAQERYGVTPDIATFAKAIASGYPLAAVVGKREIMSCGVKTSGTFNGNSCGAAAALATIEVLEKPGVYKRLEDLGQYLVKGIRELAKKYSLPVFCEAIGGLVIFEMGFNEGVKDLREWLTKSDFDLYKKMASRAEAYGVRFTARRGRQYLSLAHTQQDIERTLSVLEQVFQELGIVGK